MEFHTIIGDIRFVQHSHHSAFVVKAKRLREAKQGRVALAAMAASFGRECRAESQGQPNGRVRQSQLERMILDVEGR
jgi:hypothetical protein